ncbi:MAG TPA: helical backbone metal receptor [Sedimentisphaerales bacterium]|nr:helical backbone metal receptor [Sedimentisphaerales bacterium]
MMNRWWLLLLLILSWLAAGFVLSRSFNTPHFNNSAADNSVNRIVSTAPNLTEILFALGLDEKITAVSSDSDYPHETAKKQKTGTFWQPNIEAIIAAKPDLVLTLAFQQQADIAHRLNRMGYKTISVNIETVGDLFDAIETIGTAVGCNAAAKGLVSGIKEKLHNVSKELSVMEKVKVLYVVQRQPLRVAGTDTFINELIEYAGGQNAIGKTIHKYPPIGAETVYASGAEVIIEPTMGQKDPAQQQQSAIRYWQKFAALPAVKNNRIYVIDGDVVARLGPRICLAAETIAHCLQPQLSENR